MKKNSVVSWLLLSLLLVLLGFVSCSSSKVTISSLAIDPVKVAVDEEVIISANILSSEDKETFYQAELKINKNKIESKEISIQPGETKTVSFSYKPAELGTYTAEINGQTASFEVLNPAKFEPGKITISPETPVTGEEISFSVDVQNTGGLPGTYSGKLSINGTEISVNEVDIEPGSMKTVTTVYTFDTGGAYAVDFCDCQNDCTVLKAAECSVSTLSVSPSSVYSWESAVVKAMVKNTGEVPGTFPLEIKIDGKSKKTQTVELEADASSEISFTVSGEPVGRHTVELLDRKSSFTVKELESYTFTSYFLTISYPSEFEVIEVDDWTTLIEGTSASDGGMAVLVDPLPLDYTPRQYLDDIISTKQADQPDWTATDITDIVVDGTVIGYKYNYSHTLDGKRWAGIGRVYKNGGYGYYVCFSSWEADWTKHTSLAERCLDTFTWPKVYNHVYDNPEIGLKLQLPGEWSATETGDEVSPIVLDSGYDDPPLMTSLSLSNSEGYTAEEYTDYYVSILESNNYSNIQKQTFTFKNGYSGFECSGTGYSSNTEVKVRIITATTTSRMCSFTFTGTRSGLDSLASDINTLVASLELSTPIVAGYDRNETLFLWGGEIPNLDPAVTESTPGSYIGAIFSGLVKLNRDFEVIGDIAESWTVSEDGTVYTFKLRPDAKFHDGKPVTAADVKYSWERACNPDTESKKAGSFLNDIVGAVDMLNGSAASISGVTVINDKTLQVKIDKAKQYFLEKLTQPVAFIVDRTNVVQGSKWYEDPNGSGPFKLVEWVENTKLVLERFDDFYSTPAKLKYIYFKLYSGYPLTMYETGEIDITSVYDPNIDRVLNTADPLNKQLVKEDNTSLFYVSLNNSIAPFDDPLIRRAFALSIDVNKLIEIALNNRAERAGGYLTPKVPGYNPSLTPLDFDVEQALQLIAESKYGSVDNLPDITLSVAYGLTPEVQTIIGMWQENLGIEIKVEVISTGENFLQKMRNHELQVFFSGWGADYLDPQNFLDVLFNSESPENSVAYSNPEVDTALAAAGAESDESSRLNQYRQIEMMVLEDLPLIPLYHSVYDYVLVKPYVKGFGLFPVDINIWTDISLDAH